MHARSSIEEGCMSIRCCFLYFPSSALAESIIIFTGNYRKRRRRRKRQNRNYLFYVIHLISHASFVNNEDIYMYMTRVTFFFFFFRYRASRDTCTHIDEIISKSYRMHTTVWISDRTNNTIRCQTKHLSFSFSGFFSQRTD